MCTLFSVTDATEGGLKLLAGLMVKCSCLEAQVVDHGSGTAAPRK